MGRDIQLCDALNLNVNVHSSWIPHMLLSMLCKHRQLLLMKILLLIFTCGPYYILDVVGRPAKHIIKAISIIPYPSSVL